MQWTLIYLVHESQKRSCAYVQQTIEAFQRKGFDCHMLLLTPQSNPWLRSCGRPCQNPVEEIQSLARSTSNGLLVMDDAMVGPLFDLDEMLHKAESAHAQCCRLAKEATLFMLKGPSRSNAALVRAIVFTPDSVPAVCQQEQIEVAELYPSQDLDDLTEHPLFDEPLVMIRDRHCPFFFHRMFAQPYEDVLQRSLGYQTRLFMRWLKDESSYDQAVLWDLLLKTYHMEDLFWNLHLTYVLPRHGCDYDACAAYLQRKRIGLVMHLYYPDLLEESVGFAKRFPTETDIFITTSDENKRRVILAAFQDTTFEHVDVQVIENRGRDVSALHVGARDFCKQHEYICFYHDKKVLQTKPGSVGIGFAYRMTENLFASRDFIRNIINTFEQNPHLGILAPPPPHHADYYFTMGTSWGPNYSITKNLYDRLGLHVPIAEDKMPLAPLGSCFWFRSAAMQTLLSKPWTYEDFPPEPLPSDGTLSHAFERIRPFVCVEDGYYPAYVLNDQYAGNDYTSYRHYVRGYNQVCYRHGMLSYLRNMRQEMGKRLEK